jgi:hypothetical protein
MQGTVSAPRLPYDDDRSRQVIKDGLPHDRDHRRGVPDLATASIAGDGAGRVRTNATGRSSELLAVSPHLGRRIDPSESVWRRYGGIRPRFGTRPMGPARAGRLDLRPKKSTPDRRTPIAGALRPGFLAGPKQCVKYSRRVGPHVADIPAEQLEVGRRIVFSVRELSTRDWIEQDRAVAIASKWPRTRQGLT